MTLLHTLVDGFTVGGALKFVRGLASLDPDDDALGRATNSFDLDAGALYVRGPWRAGLTVRNIVEPQFDTMDGTPLRLERMARAGVAWLQGDWTIAVDADLTRSSLNPVAEAAGGSPDSGGRHRMAVGPAAGGARRPSAEHRRRRPRSGRDGRVWYAVWGRSGWTRRSPEAPMPGIAGMGHRGPRPRSKFSESHRSRRLRSRQKFYSLTVHVSLLTETVIPVQ